jgi:uncharacterized protein YjbJ (UPF0337 family)
LSLRRARASRQATRYAGECEFVGAFIYVLLALPRPIHHNRSSNDRDVVEFKPHRCALTRASNGAHANATAAARTRRQLMNWDQIQLDWMQFKAKVRKNWAKLTDEDLTRISGRREELVDRLQARYGFAKSEAEREIEAWMKAQRHAA